jgi:hypothetical protein
VSSEAEKQKKTQKSEEDVRSKVFSLCGVVTVTFRVSSLFVVTKWYSYSKTESVTINCSSAWCMFNTLTHRAKHTSEVANTGENT